MLPLARWIKVDGEPDFQLFLAIALETDDPPFAAVRTYWAPEALEQEDVRIRAAEAFWNDRARSAAAFLVEQYLWTIGERHLSIGDE